jgi:hypothetical protein
MVVAAAMSTAFLGATSLAQIGEPFGKDSMTKKPFDSAAMPEDGNEVVDIRIDPYFWPPLKLTPKQGPSSLDASGSGDSVVFAIPDDTLARYSVLGDRPAIAITFDIEPGWHLYWKNNGDTGMPIMLKLDLPNGVTAGEIMWPTPKRYEHSGGLLDYTYERTVTLFVPLSGVEPGQEISVKADIEFLVCQEACIPGVKAIRQSVQAVPGAATCGPERYLIESFWRVPIPPGDAAEWRWDGTTLVLEAKEAESMTFFPEAGENLRPVNPLRDGVAQGDTLRFAYHDAVRKADVVRGVLEVRNRDGSAAFYQVQAPAPK